MPDAGRRTAGAKRTADARKPLRIRRPERAKIVKINPRIRLCAAGRRNRRRSGAVDGNLVYHTVDLADPPLIPQFIRRKISCLHLAHTRTNLARAQAKKTPHGLSCTRFLYQLGIFPVNHLLTAATTDTYHIIYPLAMHYAGCVFSPRIGPAAPWARFKISDDHLPLLFSARSYTPSRASGGALSKQSSAETI